MYIAAKFQIRWIVIQYLKKIDGRMQELSVREPGSWINIYPPFSPEEVLKLSEELFIPIEFLQDSMDVDERSRFELDEELKLIVINTPVKNKNQEEAEANFITVPVAIIYHREYIITVSSQENPTIDFYLNRNIKTFDPANKEEFILQILDKNIYYFLQYLKRINLLRNTYEKELFHSSRNMELSKLITLQKSLIYFATTLRDLEVMTMKIQRTNILKLADQSDAYYFLGDVIIDTNQAREMADVYTNILNTTVDSFASIISNNLNQVMKRLTSVTIILMVPTLVASFFGMNVKLPLEQNSFGYVYIILLSMLGAFCIMYFFRKNELF